MSPITLCVKIAQIKVLLKAQFDSRQGTGDLSGHERLPTDWGFMIEQDAITGIQSVGFPIVDSDPIGIKFRHCIGTAWIKWGGFFLWDLLHQAIQLRGVGA